MVWWPTEIIPHIVFKFDHMKRMASFEYENLKSSLIKLHHRTAGGERCAEVMRKPKIKLVEFVFVAENLHPKSLPQSLMLHSQSKNVSKAFGLFVSHVDGDVDIRLGAGGIGAYLPLVATDMVHNISLFGLPINGLRNATCWVKQPSFC